ncbi:MAG: hypothetical protein JNM93_10795 [Bacteriovoracaceae bacterium]|nr:hypothetical protein [Bacteriovoracaceae bacterium]
MRILSLLLSLFLDTSLAKEPNWKYVCSNASYTLHVRDFNDAKNIIPTTKLLIFTKKKDGKLAYCLGKDNPFVKGKDYDCTPNRALLSDESIRLNYIGINITTDGKNSEFIFEEVGKAEVRIDLTCEPVKNPA